MTAQDTVREYYEALRRGEPLFPFFAEEADAVKFGIGERLTGYDAIAEGLREQTRTTDDWTVESRALRVVDRGPVAAFSDDVRMAWRDTETGETHDFETRWSGTVARDTDAATGGGDVEDVDADAEWRFVGMHVSVARPVGDGDDEQDSNDETNADDTTEAL